jgi:hypothetical protein
VTIGAVIVTITGDMLLLRFVSGVIEVITHVVAIFVPGFHTMIPVIVNDHPGQIGKVPILIVTHPDVNRTVHVVAINHVANGSATTTHVAESGPLFPYVHVYATIFHENTLFGTTVQTIYGSVCGATTQPV